MAKIIGNTAATPNPRSDWAQTDATKADYIKNKPKILTEDEMSNLIADMGYQQVQSDWNQTDETKSDYIKNKPDIRGGLLSASIVDGVLVLTQAVASYTASINNGVLTLV